MQISLSPAARAFLQREGAVALTVSSLVFSSCCSGPLPPEVKPGPPPDTDGFSEFEAAGVTVFFDSLLDPVEHLQIDLKDYGSYQELFVCE